MTQYKTPLTPLPPPFFSAAAPEASCENGMAIAWQKSQNKHKHFPKVNILATSIPPPHRFNVVMFYLYIQETYK